MKPRTVAEHQRHILRLLAPLDERAPQMVPLRSALGWTLAADVASPVDLPVFRNSSMDGYAVRAADIATVPVTIPVQGRTIAAGDAGDAPLAEGTAIKIMTGAPLPPGADSVVPVEQVDFDPTTTSITVNVTRAAGDFVREPGTDVQFGQLLARAGTVLAPRHIAALAAAGVEVVPLRRRVEVAVITTGNELVSAGTPLAPGQIYNSNGLALAAALEANGALVRMVTHSTDDPEQFRKTLNVATDTADLILTSGGVSMGDYEVVKESLKNLSGDFGKVAVQPGGPQGTAVVNGVPVICFPGNPVSTMVSFEIFLRQTLRDIVGLPEIGTETIPVTTDLRSPEGKRQFVRARRINGHVEPVAGHGSHLIASMANADVLIDIPEDVTTVSAGSPVTVWPL